MIGGPFRVDFSLCDHFRSSSSNRDRGVWNPETQLGIPVEIKATYLSYMAFWKSSGFRLSASFMAKSGGHSPSYSSSDGGVLKGVTNESSTVKKSQHSTNISLAHHQTLYQHSCLTLLCEVRKNYKKFKKKIMPVGQSWVAVGRLLANCQSTHCTFLIIVYTFRYSLFSLDCYCILETKMTKIYNNLVMMKQVELCQSY